MVQAISWAGGDTANPGWGMFHLFSFYSHFIVILFHTQANFTPLSLAFCTSKETERLSVICCFYLHPFNPHSGRVMKLWGEKDALHVSIPLWQIFHLLLYLVILSNNRNWTFTSWNTVAETFDMFLLEGAPSTYVLFVFPLSVPIQNPCPVIWHSEHEMCFWWTYSQWAKPPSWIMTATTHP